MNIPSIHMMIGADRMRYGRHPSQIMREGFVLAPRPPIPSARIAALLKLTNEMELF